MAGYDYNSIQGPKGASDIDREAFPAMFDPNGFNYLTEVVVIDSPTVAFTGKGNKRYPLSATINLSGLDETIKVKVASDNQNVILSGDGTKNNPIRGQVRIKTAQDNILVEDGGLYVPAPEYPIEDVEDSSTIDMEISGKKIVASVRLSTDSGQALEAREDGLFVAVPEQSSFEDSDEVSVIGSGTQADPFRLDLTGKIYSASDVEITSSNEQDVVIESAMDTSISAHRDFEISFGRDLTIGSNSTRNVTMTTDANMSLTANYELDLTGSSIVRLNTGGFFYVEAPNEYHYVNNRLSLIAASSSSAANAKNIQFYGGLSADLSSVTVSSSGPIVGTADGPFNLSSTNSMMNLGSAGPLSVVSSGSTAALKGAGAVTVESTGGATVLVKSTGDANNHGDLSLAPGSARLSIDASTAGHTLSLYSKSSVADSGSTTVHFSQIDLGDSSGIQITSNWAPITVNSAGGAPVTIMASADNGGSPTASSLLVSSATLMYTSTASSGSGSSEMSYRTSISATPTDITLSTQDFHGGPSATHKTSTVLLSSANTLELTNIDSLVFHGTTVINSDDSPLVVNAVYDDEEERYCSILNLGNNASLSSCNTVGLYNTESGSSLELPTNGNIVGEAYGDVDLEAHDGGHAILRGTGTTGGGSWEAKLDLNYASSTLSSNAGPLNISNTGSSINISSFGQTSVTAPIFDVSSSSSVNLKGNYDNGAYGSTMTISGSVSIASSTGSISITDTIGAPITLRTQTDQNHNSTVTQNVSNVQTMVMSMDSASTISTSYLKVGTSGLVTEAAYLTGPDVAVQSRMNSKFETAPALVRSTVTNLLNNRSSVLTQTLSGFSFSVGDSSSPLAFNMQGSADTGVSSASLGAKNVSITATQVPSDTTGSPSIQIGIIPGTLLILDSAGISVVNSAKPTSIATSEIILSGYSNSYDAAETHTILTRAATDGGVELASMSDLTNEQFGLDENTVSGSILVVEQVGDPGEEEPSVVVVPPGTQGQVLTIGSTGIPEWVAPSVGTDWYVGTFTSATRPASPTEGQYGYDTTIDCVVWYIGNQWKNAAGAIV